MSHASAAASDDGSDAAEVREPPHKANRQEVESAAPAASRLADFISKTCDVSGLEPSSQESVYNFIWKQLEPKLQASEDIWVTVDKEQRSKGYPGFPDSVNHACSSTFMEWLPASKPGTRGALIKWVAGRLASGRYKVRVSTETPTIFTVAAKAAARGSGAPVCIQSAEGCLLASAQERIDAIERREVRAEHRPWALASTVDVAEADVLGAAAFTDVVGVVVGPSGVGKTRFMLTAKPRHAKRMLTFYMTADQIELCIRGMLADAAPAAYLALLPHLQRAAAASPTSATPALQAGIDAMAGRLAGAHPVAVRVEEVGSGKMDVPKTARNASVLAAIAALVRNAVYELERAANLAGSGWEGLDAGSDVRVRLAIDEAGLHEGVTRAVIASGDSIRAIVRAACKITDAAVPVDVLVGGTGSGAPERAHGSEHHRARYRVLDMHACFSEMFSEAFALPRSVRGLLEDATNPATSQSVLAALDDLVSNARLGALLHAGLVKVDARDERWTHLGFPKNLQPEIHESLDALESHVRGVAIDAMRCFYSLNGLSTLPQPVLQGVLADAMCIDVNGFDSIQDTRTDKEKQNGRLPPRDRLVARYGVLHDRARLALRSEVTSSERVLKDPPSAFDGAANAAEGAVLCVPDDCRGRYVMLPAARELFLTECVRQFPRVHGGDDPEGLERLLWQWGAALQLCVFEGSSLRELLGHVCRGREPLDATPSALIPVPGRDKAFARRALAAGVGTGPAPTPGQQPRQHWASQLSRGGRGSDPFSSAARGTVPTLGKLSGMHLVKAQAPFPAKLDCLSMLDTGTPSAMSVLNVPKASAGDVAVCSLLATHDEFVALQAKLHLQTSVSQSGKAGLDTEFSKMVADGATQARPGVRKLQTRVYFVAGPPSHVDSRNLSLPAAPDTPGADVCHKLVHVETDSRGVLPSVVQTQSDARSEPDADLWRFRPLYPMAMGRFTTWADREGRP